MKWWFINSRKLMGSRMINMKSRAQASRQIICKKYFKLGVMKFFCFVLRISSLILKGIANKRLTVPYIKYSSEQQWQFMNFLAFRFFCSGKLSVCCGLMFSRHRNLFGNLNSHRVLNCTCEANRTLKQQLLPQCTH